MCLGLMVIISCWLTIIQACHYAEYLDRRKRSTTTTNSSSDSFDSNRLIYWFTVCMQNRSSLGSYDWGSVAEWTVTDSNWFLYTENSNCKDTEGVEETECWINRVSSFIDDPVASTLRSCIYEYSSYKYSSRNGSVSRKKRQTIPSPILPSMPPCPNVVRRLYRMALLEEIPRKKRRQTSMGVPEVPDFDIDAVSSFVENYTTCSECSRYNEGEAAAQCWTNRFDQLTKDNSV
uniref:C-type lectin domain-containing protein n=2 Tax=Ciona intestinalis TaxID=7719 RepID=H2XQU1_CIOIN